MPTHRTESSVTRSPSVSRSRRSSSVQRGFNLLHARVSYSFNDGRSQIALWGKNLTDETYLDTVVPVISLLGVAIRFYRMPRTGGGEISLTF